MSDTPSRFRRLQEIWRLACLAVQLAWRASPGLLSGVLLLIAVQALLPPLQLALARAVLDRAALDLRLATTPDPLAAQLSLSTWIVLAAAGLAAGQLAQPFIATFQSLAGDRLTAYVAEQLMRATNRWQGLARFEDPSFADDLQRARTRAANGGLTLVTHGALVVVTLLTTIGLALLLSGLHPLIPILLILTALPSIARYGAFGEQTGSHIYWHTPETRRLEYSRDVLLAPETAKDVRLYELGPFFQQYYEAIFVRTAGMLNRLRRRLMVPMALSNSLSATAAGAIYIYVVWLVARGERTVGDLVLYGGAATLLQIHLLDLGLSASTLPMEFGFLPSLFRVLEAAPDLPISSTPRQAPRPIKQGIAFENIAFAYPSQSLPVLRDVSFRIRPGESVALVGQNGAGKTTIVKLLLRLYDPTAGRILLDDVDLREYDLEDLRRAMGVIFQDFARYELTAGENIGLGQVESIETHARLLEAAARAGAGDLIQQLPKGLDTPLGREFGDQDLSGGEWQKLALARAFVRDCQLLVLDEPTAALDVPTEYTVYTRFHDLTRDRMTILISHRFSTVRMADRILYLSDGRIQEEGSHAELLARKGDYARLYWMQAAQYLDSDDPEAST